LLNFWTAAEADVEVLNVSLMQTSAPPETDFELVISPQRLKMAATSSAVVPATNPITSTTFPLVAEPAPLIDNWLGFDEAVASRSAFCVIALMLTFGAVGLSVRRAEREPESYRS
jgi:hypothetical protein